MAKRSPRTPLLSAEQAKLRHDVMDEAVFRFSGQLDELESALGMYVMGRHFGWKVLYLIHTKRTVKKYEEILGIKVSEEFEPLGPDSVRTNAAKVLESISNFWKVVSGEEKIPLDREERRTVK